MLKLSLLTILMTSMAVPAFSGEITIAAAGGYRKPLTELVTVYEKNHQDKVYQVYGHMGQIVSQAKESNDIALLCGDKSVLDHSGLEFQSMLDLGPGRLVLAFRKGLTLDNPSDIVKDEFKRIGIPDQKNAIYGMAGRQFLDRSQLADKVDGKLVPVASVPQVTSYLVSGDLDAGFVNATDAMSAGDKIGGFIVVSTRDYDAIKIACGLITERGDKKTVNAFIDFLQTQTAKDILTRYGL
ncbi:molybdate ABC transporter substrate-binding protein [Bartonella sp. LJL80]